MMSLGRFEKKAIEISVKKATDKIIRTVDQTIEKNPALTMEEALRIVEKKQGVFFPAEQSDDGDLKSLFTRIVWKAYRSAHLQDPDASSPERREFVSGLVQRYLNGGERNNKVRFAAFFRPLPLAACTIAVIVILTIVWSWNSKILTNLSYQGKNTHTASSVIIAHSPSSEKAVNMPSSAKDTYQPVSAETTLFRYHGYASDDRRKMALVNKSIYHEGDLLGEEEQYMLKSIHPKHIVIKNINARSEFSVALQ